MGNMDSAGKKQKNGKINSTGVTGVSMDRGKYRATIYVDNKKVDLGRHDTLEEAAEARRQGEIKYWGVSA